MNELLIKKNNGDYEAAESFNKLKIIWLPGCSAAKIVVHESVLIRGSLAIAIHNNSKIVIENNCIFEGANHISTFKDCEIHIGRSTMIRGASILLSNEFNLKVSIGEDCLIAPGVYIRPSDAHTIYDIDSQHVLNKPTRGICIDNHVWIGQDAFICKDVHIPQNCVIGARSLVTNKQFEPNSIIAGCPARTVKRGINWSKKFIWQFEKDIKS